MGEHAASTVRSGWSPKALIARVMEAGVGPDDPEPRARKIRLTNALCLLLGTVTFPYVFVFAAVGVRILALVVVPISLSYALLAFLNAKRLHQSARLGIIVVFSSAVFLYSNTLGHGSGIHLLCYPILCLPPILFELRERRALLAGNVASISLPFIIHYAPSHIFGAYALPAALEAHIHGLLIGTASLFLLAGVYLLVLYNSRAEAELDRRMESLRLLDSARLSTRDGVVILAAEEGAPRVLQANPASVGMLPRPFTLRVGANWALLESAGPVVDGAVGLRAAFAEGRHTTAELAFPCGVDGGIWLRVTLAPFRHDGRISAFIATIADISDVKRAEKRIEEQNVRIFAAAKMSSLGEMSAGIAHEINNPITIIEGRARQLGQLLSSGPQGADTVKMLEIAESIRRTSLRIATIVKGMRAFSRHEDDAPFRPVALQEVLDDTLALCAERFRHGGVALEVAGSPDDRAIPVDCQPSQVSQVLINLLANAFDALDGRADARVRIVVERRDAGRVEVRVEDNAGAIPPHVVERLFQPFYTSKPVGKGTGLGLSISRAIVEKHRGSLLYEGSEGWTRFTIRLPVSVGKAPSAGGVRMRKSS